MGEKVLARRREERNVAAVILDSSWVTSLILGILNWGLNPVTLDANVRKRTALRFILMKLCLGAMICCGSSSLLCSGVYQIC